MAPVAAGYHTGQLSRTRLYSAPWKHHALPSSEVFPLAEERTVSQPLPLKCSPWRRLVFRSAQSQILLRQYRVNFFRLEIRGSTIYRMRTQAKMHTAVTEADSQIKRRFQRPHADEHVCQLQDRTHGAFFVML